MTPTDEERIEQLLDGRKILSEAELGMLLVLAPTWLHSKDLEVRSGFLGTGRLFSLSYLHDPDNVYTNWPFLKDVIIVRREAMGYGSSEYRVVRNRRDYKEPFIEIQEGEEWRKPEFR